MRDGKRRRPSGKQETVIIVISDEQRLLESNSEDLVKSFLRQVINCFAVTIIRLEWPHVSETTFCPINSINYINFSEKAT